MKKTVLTIFFISLIGIVVTNFRTHDHRGQFDTMRTKAKLIELEIMLRDYYSQHHHLPEQLSVFDQTYITDNWGKQFIYKTLEHKVILTCIGSDGVLHTADDTSHEFTIP